MFYPGVTPEQAAVMIDTVIHLQDLKFFKAMYAHNSTEAPATRIESETDCARHVAKHVFPGRDGTFYKRFVGRDAASLAEEFIREGVQVHMAESVASVPPNHHGVVITPTHCIYIL